MSVKPIPEGYHSITAYLIVKDGKAALDFYKKAFGATEILRMEMPDGKIGHAEIKIGDSVVMLAEGCPEMGFSDPETYGGSPVSLLIYTEDVDATAKQATEAGIETLRPIQDQFYGDRSGTFKDPFGHTWTIATHVEDVSEEELHKRMAEWTSKKEAG